MEETCPARLGLQDVFFCVFSPNKLLKEPNAIHETVVAYYEAIHLSLGLYFITKC